MASYTSRYRDLTILKNSTALIDLENASRFDATKITAMAIAAEEFLLGYGEPVTWGDRQKVSFDAAVRAILVREISEPTTAYEAKIGEHNLKFSELDKVPQVANWIAVLLAGNRGLKVAHRDRV